MDKATHTGECQWCGSRQKLPGGLLSKHGYTVADGWFEGVCLGANKLPYEQSRDLIEQSIEWAKKYRSTYMAERKNVRKIDPEKTDMTWMEIRLKYIGLPIWVYGKMVPISDSKVHHEFIPDGGSPVLNHIQSRTNVDFLSVKIKQGNKNYENHLTEKIKRIDRYIAQQQKRFDDWKLKALQPVENEMPKKLEAKPKRRRIRYL